LPCSVPLLPPTMSFAFPSPGHQPTIPDGSGTHVGADVGVGEDVGVAVGVGVKVAVGVGVNVAVGVGVNVAVAVGVVVGSLGVGVDVAVAVGVGVVLHWPAVPALKIAWISESERARLKIWTSSMTPFQVRGKP